MTVADIVSVWLGTALAVMGFSFIWFGDTIFFGFVEHLYLGGCTAYTWFTVVSALSSSAFIPIAAGRVSLIIAFILGILSFARMTKYRWMARYPVSVMSGVGVGVTIGLIIDSQLVKQLSATVSNIAEGTPDPVSAILILIGVLTSLVYFTYSREHTGKLGIVVTVGRLFLMASFGYVLAADNILHADGLITGLMSWIKDPLATIGITWG